MRLIATITCFLCIYFLCCYHKETRKGQNKHAVRIEFYYPQKFYMGIRNTERGEEEKLKIGKSKSL